ncbi:hypothetical protein H1Z61_05575 [Bacillus aquiflavi]|uniref:N-acetyltransferase domain-containing protein n=1 Tax=Bacillus aquiflavi TaxID=2672567 RepID=A0A6B3VVI0_9BACI|nr:hypothetical protein [Bacillus aquiflavi]MBA4536624.1 hypothetical protein [Bacillus aquiflavi]NEY80992.1 hypothetical protein [Bacillus aquiflavi]UAC47935.1 hypothetical protein K6959_15235 [Bacillus aquiflavi]
MQTVLRRANKCDLPKLIDFLDRANIGTEGITSSVDYFVLMEDVNCNIKTTLGIEPLGEIGVLRSLVLTPGTSEEELLALFEQILHLAKEKEMKEIYLASNKQETVPFLEMLGFSYTGMKELPKKIFESEHVSHLLTVDDLFFMKLFI